MDEDTRARWLNTAAAFEQIAREEEAGGLVTTSVTLGWNDLSRLIRAVVEHDMFLRDPIPPKA